MRPGLTPSLRALDAAILAALRDAFPLPSSTAELARRVGRPSQYDASAVVYPRLLRLLRHGVVVRDRWPDRRDVTWTLAEPPAPWPVGEWNARLAAPRQPRRP